MTSYALIGTNNQVAQIAAATFPVAAGLSWIDVTSVSPAPQAGWSYAGGIFTAPAPPAAPSSAQKLVTALGAGVTVNSTSTSSIDGLYGCSAQDEINIVGLQVGIAAGAAWLGYYRDLSGAKHTVTATQFTALAEAILGFTEALDEAYGAGGSGSAPTAIVTIA